VPLMARSCCRAVNPKKPRRLWRRGSSNPERACEGHVLEGFDRIYKSFMAFASSAPMCAFHQCSHVLELAVEYVQSAHT